MTADPIETRKMTSQSVKHNRNSPDAGQASSPARTFAMIWLMLMALLQWLVFVQTGTFENRLIGVLVAGSSGLLFLIPLNSNRRFLALAVLGVIACGNFISHLLVSSDPFPARLLQISVIYGYLGLLVAAVGQLLGRRIGTGLLVSAFVGATGLVAIEGVLGVIGPHRTVKANIVRWEGGTRPHPVLEESYPPNSVARTIYLSNPRGYFETSDPRSTQWRLGSNHPGSAARLLLPESEFHDVVRVEIDRAEVPTTWHVQLTYDGLALKRGVRYQLSFKARADNVRPFSYGVSQAHPPWDNLGWYEQIDIGTEWEEYSRIFRATATDDEARMTFDLGDAIPAVEIKTVVIHQLDSGQSVVRTPPPEYAVSYRFNDHGCRGPDYPVEKPANVRRILVLGDSFALGVGVHERDTFSAQLERTLNKDLSESPEIRYEVINCGVSGYSTTQERALLEIIGPEYRPDVVVLAMVSNDDSSWRSDVNNGYFHTPNKYEYFFNIFGLTQSYRHEMQKPPADFRESLQQVLQMRDIAQRIDAKLVAFAFRPHPLDAGPWRALIDTIAPGLRGSGVPWLDVGELLLSQNDWQSLIVHPDGDMHPNEIAHLSAAEQIADLLHAQKIL